MKPFKGIISTWQINSAGCVTGICVFHTEMEEKLTPQAFLNDRIVKAEKIHTSRIMSLENRGTFHLLETKNSWYVLVNQI